MVEIDQAQDQQQRGEEHREGRREPRADPEREAHVQQPVRELDGGIADRDGLAAGTATASEQQEAQDRDVVEGADQAAAAGATGGWQHHRKPQRDPLDADIGEAADHEADGEAEPRPERRTQQLRERFEPGHAGLILARAA